MRLTQKVLALIHDKRIRNRLAMALDKTDFTIIRYIKDNDDALTKAAALQVIREETGLPDEEILEEEGIRA